MPPCQMRRVVVVVEVYHKRPWDDCVHIKCFMARVRKFGLGLGQLGKLLLLCPIKERERERTQSYITEQKWSPSFYNPK